VRHTSRPDTPTPRESEWRRKSIKAEAEWDGLPNRDTDFTGHSTEFFDSADLRQKMTFFTYVEGVKWKIGLVDSRGSNYG
jgi:hypothetical protein